MAEFVEGIFVKKIETQYGEILKLSFDVDKFINYLEMSGDVVVSEANGRKYFNAEIKTSKGGKPYIAVDTFKPAERFGGDSTNPFEK